IRADLSASTACSRLFCTPLKASLPSSPWSKRAFCEANSRSASCSFNCACVRPPETSDRDCAWLTSGSTAASTSPDLTTAPSRTRSDSTRPETADLTSTLVTGSTTPTSRTETCSGSSWTLPSRNGLASAFGSFLSRLRAATSAPPATTTTTAPQSHLFLFLVITPSRSMPYDDFRTCPLSEEALRVFLRSGHQSIRCWMQECSKVSRGAERRRKNSLSLWERGGVRGHQPRRKAPPQELPFPT